MTHWLLYSLYTQATALQSEYTYIHEADSTLHHAYTTTTGDTRRTSKKRENNKKYYNCVVCTAVALREQARATFLKTTERRRGVDDRNIYIYLHIKCVCLCVRRNPSTKSRLRSMEFIGRAIKLLLLWFYSLHVHIIRCILYYIIYVTRLLLILSTHKRILCTLCLL